MDMEFDFIFDDFISESDEESDDDGFIDERD